MAAQTDAIVIGAGVSGLAAAGELARRGWTVQVIEARSRVGGRILSSQPKGWSVPVELGAEFIHGGNDAIKNRLKKSGIVTRPADANMWWRDKSSGVIALLPDFWERVGRVVARIPERVPAWSFGKFLRQMATQISPPDRYLSELYVGSFEAAPINEISAAALRDDRAGTQTDDRKIVGRYDRLVDSLRKALPENRVRLALGVSVEAVRWSDGKIVVRANSSTEKTIEYTAAGVVVTLPLGVLKTKRVQFSPRLKDKDSLIAKMGWGHVVRVVFRFKKGFWTAPFMPLHLGASSGKSFGFVNAPGQPLPVWWALNAPAPMLTGWAGGEVSRPLRRLSPTALREEALHSLAAIFGTTASKLKRWLAGWQYHSWSSDPFSLGSYSFPRAGLEQAAQELARPVSSTIFFAGEATAKDYGTVHGAVESGLRAATEMDRALSRRQKS